MTPFDLEAFRHRRRAADDAAKKPTGPISALQLLRACDAVQSKETKLDLMALPAAGAKVTPLPQGSMRGLGPGGELIWIARRTRELMVQPRGKSARAISPRGTKVSRWEVVGQRLHVTERAGGSGPTFVTMQLDGSDRKPGQQGSPRSRIHAALGKTMAAKGYPGYRAFENPTKTLTVLTATHNTSGPKLLLHDRATGKTYGPPTGLEAWPQVGLFSGVDRVAATMATPGGKRELYAMEVRGARCLTGGHGKRHGGYAAFGDQLAYGRKRHPGHELHLASVSTGVDEVIGQATGPITVVRSASRGFFALVHTKKKAHLFFLTTTGKVQRLAELHDRGKRSPRVSPDGTRILLDHHLVEWP